MHPIVATLELGGIERPIGSYGLFLLLGLLVAGGLVVRAAWRGRQDEGAAIAAVGSAIGGGLVGAFLFHVLVSWALTGDPMAGVRGGLVFYGAPFGAFLGALVAARALKLRLWLVLDLSVPALALAHGLGRIGCFLGGCCYGSPCELPWACTYPSAGGLPEGLSLPSSVPRHPAPLYEALGLFLLGLAFALVRPERPGSGRRAALYLGAYGLLRFVVELFRGDPERGFPFGGPLSTSQLVSLLALGLALAWLARGREGRLRPGLR